MASKQPANEPATVDATDLGAAEWGMVIVTGFTAMFAGPFALIPAAFLGGMFLYRTNPALFQATKAGQFVRGLLPAPADDQADDQADEQPAVASSSPAPVAKVAKAPAAAALTTMPEMLTLAELARCSTILVVGSRGSGKTTLLRALLSTRREAIMVYDPHAAPHDWQMATMTHNSEASMASGLVGAYKRLETRKGERRSGARTEGWPSFTLAADEWRAIIEDVQLPKEIGRTPVEISSKLMREGRKFNIGMVIGAHGTTNSHLGCVGDNAGFLNSFDWIIYLGAEAKTMYKKHAPDLWADVPMARNPQGGTFPLVAICISPTTGDVCYLDMNGFTQYAPAPKPAKKQAPWITAAPTVEDGLLAGMLSISPGDMGTSPSNNEGTAAESEGTEGDMGTVTAPTPQEITFITMSLSRGQTVSQTAKAMKGYNGRTRQALMAKVEYVKGLIESQSGDDS